MHNGKLIAILAGMVIVCAVAALAIFRSMEVPAPQSPIQAQTGDFSATTSEDTLPVPAENTVPQNAVPENTSSAPVAPPAGTVTSPVQDPAPKTGFTLAEIALHASASSCWSAINGNVYDLTGWIAQHPGGSGAIMGICGKDGSSAFNGQHGGGKKQADMLATFRIGALVN